jgi:SPP1 family predicted phage head-tail adaptor
VSIRSKVFAPALDQRITFQRISIERDEFGRQKEVWTTLGTVWARVDGRRVDQSRREQYRSDSIQTMHDYDVWVRSDVYTRLDLQTRDRILWKNKIFDIVDIPDQQIKGNLIGIFCREGSSNG